MLELLVTSHGSSKSRGAEQGTGCSWGLRAINIQGAGRTGQGETQREEDGRGGKSGREKNGKEEEEVK